MNKKIAIVTGATGGIGKCFIPLLINEVDEIWAIARNQKKLTLLRDELGSKIRIFSKDLSVYNDILDLEKVIEDEKPHILYLINNAGIAKMGKYSEFALDEIQNTIDLNCSAPLFLSNICIPHMPIGSHILNISSASAFQPLPFLNLYASTKVFLRNYSRALNIELKEKKITVTAVCPSWVDTELLSKEINGKPVKFDKLVSAEAVAKKALRDAKKGKDMSVLSLYVKIQHLLAKLFPQRMTMKTWLYKIRKYQDQ